MRSFSYWNWMEPRPGDYEMEDFDRFFDLAETHGLSVWLDITLATHGACPEWLIREHPDMRTVNHQGQPSSGHSTPATPQGAMIHCYDHPAWRERGGALLRHVVERYRDRPNLLVWGLWDGVSPAWPRHGDGLPCYCEHTRARYKAWLRERYSLEELNARVLRRYRDWEDVEPPRSNHNVVEMLLYLRFHRRNLVDHLRWMVAEARSIDPLHEIRAHAASTPRPWDDDCAREVDSWGMSMSSSNLLTSEEPHGIADRVFSFDLSRSQGVDGRWWNEEIYAGMSPGGVTWKKQSDPRELTSLLWMTLAGGAAGCMFWQYRPEYLSFEAPGYNLAALDGRPTARLRAVGRAVDRIEAMKDHLPLECPRAEVGIVYDPASQELFGLNGQTERFNADLRGVYRTLWRNGIPADILSPRMDWSGYRLLFLPNLALMSDGARDRIHRTLEESPGTRLVAEGSFGLYQENGLSSEAPPEGFAQRFGVRIEDFSAVTAYDIRRGENRLETPLRSGERHLAVRVCRPRACGGLDGDRPARRPGGGHAQRRRPVHLVRPDPVGRVRGCRPSVAGPRPREGSRHRAARGPVRRPPGHHRPEIPPGGMADLRLQPRADRGAGDVASGMEEGERQGPAERPGSRARGWRLQGPDRALGRGRALLRMMLD